MNIIICFCIIVRISFLHLNCFYALANLSKRSKGHEKHRLENRVYPFIVFEYVSHRRALIFCTHFAQLKRIQA